jgi:hypothetical protein
MNLRQSVASSLPNTTPNDLSLLHSSIDMVLREGLDFYTSFKYVTLVTFNSHFIFPSSSIVKYFCHKKQILSHKNQSVRSQGCDTSLEVILFMRH